MHIDITSLDVEQSFWEKYPEFKVVEPFKSLYIGDKSKGRKNSSSMCWFISICYANTSAFSKKPKDGKDGSHQVVGEDYLLDKNYYTKNENTLTMLIDAFIEHTMTPMQREVYHFERKLEERREVLRDTRYTLDNYDRLDKALSSTTALEVHYSKLVDRLYKEGEDGATWGDQEESASEKGLI